MLDPPQLDPDTLHPKETHSWALHALVQISPKRKPLQAFMGANSLSQSKSKTPSTRGGHRPCEDVSSTRLVPFACLMTFAIPRLIFGTAQNIAPRPTLWTSRLGRRCTVSNHFIVSQDAGVQGVLEVSPVANLVLSKLNSSILGVYLAYQLPR